MIGNGKEIASDLIFRNLFCVCARMCERLPVKGYEDDNYRTFICVIVCTRNNSNNKEGPDECDDCAN